MNKIEEFINKILDMTIDEQIEEFTKTWLEDFKHSPLTKQKLVKMMSVDLQSLINSAVEEANIKIAILEQEVDSWKNVFSKELVEEQKEKDAEIAKSKKYKEVETFYQNGINSVIEKIAKEILEQ